MNVEFTLKNYRCFSDEAPARFCIRDGFVSFIGPNNAGKSSILKFFYEFRNLFSRFQEPGAIHAAIQSEQGFSWGNSIHDPAEAFYNGNQRDLTIEMHFFDLPQSHPPPVQKARILIRRNGGAFSLELRTSTQTTQKAAPRIDNDTLHQDGISMRLTDMCESFAALERSFYFGPFRNAIHVGTGENYFDLNIGQSFITQWRDYKTGLAVGRREMAYQVTEQIKHIFGFADLQIDPSVDGKTLQLLIDGRAFTLSQLGAGLAQFIVVLINAAISKPALILIDEPESHLHATLQVDFLTTLASYAKFGVAFATHNIGLARSVSELVYGVRREGASSKVWPIDAMPRLAEFAGEMGFFGFKQLGFEQLLLVEGPTEVRTFHQFLRKIRMDHQIVVLPLGGSGLIAADREHELAELLRITGKTVAVIDSERASAGAELELPRSNFKQTCEKLNIRCHVLERRALENYLSEAAVHRVKGEKYRALARYEKLESVNPTWAKAENWKIAREMDLADLDGTDLGEFLQSL